MKPNSILSALADAGALMAGASRRGSGASSGATPQPTGQEIKAGTRRVTLPAFLQSKTQDRSQSIARVDPRVATLDISRLSRVQDTGELVRSLTKMSPALSSSASAHRRVAITKSYKVKGFSPDGKFNRDVTAAAQQLVSRLDNSPSFDGVANINYGLRNLSESLAVELVNYGAMGCELVLDEARYPSYIAPVTTAPSKFEFRPGKDGRLAPFQDIDGVKVSLDIPTFFYASLDQDILEAYSRSPFESAIKPTFFSETLMSDILRVARRAVHPRQVITLIEQGIKDSAPRDIAADPVKLEKYVDDVVRDVADNINNLAPEDALVLMDSVDAKLLNNGNSSISREWMALEKMGNANLSTGTKTPPTILGQHEGGSNIASAEIQLFIKQVQGSVQEKLNALYSQILTLGVRLMGMEGHVKFEYADVELRSDLELEAFKSVKQSRMLELLSLGVITDDEFHMEMFGKLPSEGAIILSGTNFKSQKPADDNPNGESNSGSTLNQNRKSDAPTGVKGKNNQRDPQKE